MNISEISREKLTQIAKANDPNGIWLDNEAIAEGYEPATIEYLIETFTRWANEEGISLDELISQFY